MDIFQNFILDGTTYKVSILWKENQPFFRATEIAKIIGISNIRTSIATFTDLEKCSFIHPTEGGPQLVTFLTEHGLYRVLMTSRKPKARAFKTWVYEVISSIRTTGQYALPPATSSSGETEAPVPDRLAAEAARLREKTEKDQHAELLGTYGDCPVIYLAKLAPTAEGELPLFAMGWTRDLAGQMETIPKARLCCVIKTQIHRYIEGCLRKHPHFIACAEKDTAPVLYRMSSQDYDKAENILRRKVVRAESGTLNQKERQEFEEVRAAFEAMDIENCKRLVEAHATRGPKVQRYSPDGKELLATYLGFTEATRDPLLPAEANTVSMRDAIQSRSLLYGFRWATLDRDLPDSTIQDIGDTVVRRKMTKGMIAMLNDQKEYVVSVFQNQKAAAEDRGFSSTATMSLAIKRGTLAGGHYFQKWEDVLPELQEAYLARQSLPEEASTANSSSRPIEKLNPQTGEVAARYSSVTEVLKTFRMSHVSLMNAIRNNHEYIGWNWRYAGETA